jgi:hypothetical protein
MNPFKSFVDLLEKVLKMGRVVANIGAPQLIKQLDAIRSNLEQFKKAASEDDTAKMRQLLSECEVECDSLKTRLFKGLDDKTNKSLDASIQKARKKKRAIMTVREQAPTKQEIRKALKAKSEKMANTISTKKGRQELVVELDDAIGKLRGISKSLESFKL